MGVTGTVPGVVNLLLFGVAALTSWRVCCDSVFTTDAVEFSIYFRINAALKQSLASLSAPRLHNSSKADLG